MTPYSQRRNSNLLGSRQSAESVRWHKDRAAIRRDSRAARKDLLDALSAASNPAWNPAQ